MEDANADHLAGGERRRGARSLPLGPGGCFTGFYCDLLGGSGEDGGYCHGGKNLGDTPRPTVGRVVDRLASEPSTTLDTPLHRGTGLAEMDRVATVETRPAIAPPTV